MIFAIAAHSAEALEIADGRDSMTARVKSYEPSGLMPAR
jgi:hypothetical protein